jgi:hypothetical protein
VSGSGLAKRNRAGIQGWASRQAREGLDDHPTPKRGLAILGRWLVSAGDTIRAQSRELKFWEIFQFARGSAVAVLDFESDLLSEGSARSDRGADERET